MERIYRKTIRLSSWDYSRASSYHVIMCAEGRAPLFGRIVERAESASIEEPIAHVELSEVGGLCVEALELAGETYERFSIDVFSIMPNHVHVLVTVSPGEGGTLSSFVRFIKANVTKAARKSNPGLVVWQPRFYEHIIRDDKDYAATWEYIENNPAKWAEDRFWVAG